MDELSSALTPTSPAERRQRLASLRTVPTTPTALGILSRALGDEDPGVRKEVVRLLTRQPATQPVLAAVEEALVDTENVGRRAGAMEVLGGMGAGATSLLERLARDPRGGVRRLAVDALGMTKSPEAVPALLRAARDSMAAVRAAALEGLERIATPDAVKALKEAVTNTEELPSVVLAGLLGLIALNETVPAATLRRHLTDALTAPPALRLLGRVGDVATLVDVLIRGTGARQRSALLGLLEALDRNSLPVIEALTRAADDVRPKLRLLVENGDAHVAAGALTLGAHLLSVELFPVLARRDDRALLTSQAHRAAAILDERIHDLASRLEDLIHRDPSSPGAELLAEIAEASRRRVRSLAAAERRGERPSVIGAAHLRPEDLVRLAELLETTAGLQISTDARVRLEARLAPRLEHTGATTFAAYIDLLQGSQPASERELRLAIELVTVHETYFFRERVQLGAFRDEVLPQLVQRAERTRMPVRIWSAGCSSGEEAYTLAILLEESGHFSSAPAAVQFEVIGTDIAEGEIVRGRAGVYGPKSFRAEIEPTVRRRYFVDDGNSVHVHPSLRARVRFECMNLLESGSLPRFDAIFCRNVLIYMGKAARARVVERFYERLVPGGVLFLGHSESLLHVETPFRLLPLSRELAYRRSDVAPGDERPRPPRSRP